MTAPPLTHHDILALAEPFARRGRRVDLAASDRIARRVVFQEMQRGALREVLQLDDLGTGTRELTRTLTHPGGLQTTLEAMGPSPQELLDRIEAVAPDSQFSEGEGFVVARSYAASGVGQVLRLGLVQVDGLKLAMTISPVSGVSADIVLTETAEHGLALPEDTLAVLGWDWARLIRQKDGWKSKLRLRGRPDRRTRTAESALACAAAHLARTLAEPPSRYHEQNLKARYGVVLRRAIPLLTPIALVITVLSLPRFDVEASPLWWLMYHVPTVLIALSFLLQDLPQFEIPPWPRPRRDSSWRVPRDASGAAGRSPGRAAAR